MLLSLPGNGGVPFGRITFTTRCSSIWWASFKWRRTFLTCCSSICRPSFLLLSVFLRPQVFTLYGVWVPPHPSRWHHRLPSSLALGWQCAGSSHKSAERNQQHACKWCCFWHISLHRHWHIIHRYLLHSIRTYVELIIRSNNIDKVLVDLGYLTLVFLSHAQSDFVGDAGIG